MFITLSGNESRCYVDCAPRTHLQEVKVAAVQPSETRNSILPFTTFLLTVLHFKITSDE
jgi:hypothetical protein